jgi:hypothetical protein
LITQILFDEEYRSFSGDKIEKNEIGGVCSTYGGEDRCIQGFGGETWGKEITWKAQAWVRLYY